MKESVETGIMIGTMLLSITAGSCAIVPMSLIAFAKEEKTIKEAKKTVIYICMIWMLLSLLLMALYYFAA